MNRHLTRSRERFRTLLLDLLWAQWDSLGVSGHAAWSKAAVIDPDALLVFSCSIARHDARLFDEMLDWIAINGRFLNIQRAANIARKNGSAGGPVLSAVADFMSRRDTPAKWTRLAGMFRRADAGPESLFFFADGKPLPAFGKTDPVFLEHGYSRGPVALREHSRPFLSSRPANLWLALRALLGVNARCEILLYLLLNGKGHARGIARETCFFQKTIQDALSEMGQSGFLHGQTKGRERIYTLKSDAWAMFMGRGQSLPRWTNWPAVFAALEAIWFTVTAPEMESREDLMLGADLNGLVRKIAPLLTQAGVPHQLEPRPIENAAEYVRTALEELETFIGEVA